MGLALFLVGLAFGLVGFLCNLIILIDAFRSSVGEGFMCLCIPCFILFYMFTKFEHPQKTLIIAGALVGSGIGNVLVRTSGFGSAHSFNRHLF